MIFLFNTYYETVIFNMKLMLTESTPGNVRLKIKMAGGLGNFKLVRKIIQMGEKMIYLYNPIKHSSLKARVVRNNNNTLYIEPINIHVNYETLHHRTTNKKDSMEMVGLYI